MPRERVSKDQVKDAAKEAADLTDEELAAIVREHFDGDREQNGQGK